MRLDHLLSKEQRPGNTRSISQLITSYSKSSDAFLVVGIFLRVGLGGTWATSVPFSGLTVRGPASAPARDGFNYLACRPSLAPGNPDFSQGFRLLLENCIASTSILFSKLQEPTVDALAPEADEGRG